MSRFELDSSLRGRLMLLLLSALWLITFWIANRRLGLSVGCADGSSDGCSVRCCVLLWTCMLPGLLCICIAFISSRSGSPPPAYEFADYDQNDKQRSAKESAQRDWLNEQTQTYRIHSRRFHHACIYGFLSSMALAGSLIVISPAIPLRNMPTVPVNLATALAVASATFIAFLKDFGRMVTRVAARDLGGQMLAWSSKQLLAVITATVLATLFAPARLGGQPVPNTIVGAVVIGATIALLGEPAVRAIRDRLAAALGVASLRSANAQGWELIDGIDEETKTRLEEEGIDSVHALAYFSTPRLFFVSRFTLKRICDWQDQALLVARHGTSRAQSLREKFGVRTLTSAAKWATLTLAMTDPQKAIEDIQKVLGFSTVTQASNFLGGLVSDPMAAAMETFLGVRPKA